MSEPTIEGLTAELATLRSVKDELLSSKHTLKARVTELEKERDALSEVAEKAVATVRAVVIDKPVRDMVTALCPAAPDLLLSELAKDYDFDADTDGNLVVKSKADSKVIAAKDGKPVAFEKLALHRYLIGDGYLEKSDRQRLYTHLLNVPVASGGASRTVRQLPINQSVTDEKKIEFGLR